MAQDETAIETVGDPQDLQPENLARKIRQTLRGARKAASDAEPPDWPDWLEAAADRLDDLVEEVGRLQAEVDARGRKIDEMEDEQDAWPFRETLTEDLWVRSIRLSGSTLLVNGTAVATLIGDPHSGVIRPLTDLVDRLDRIAEGRDL